MIKHFRSFASKFLCCLGQHSWGEWTERVHGTVEVRECDYCHAEQVRIMKGGDSDKAGN